MSQYLRNDEDLVRELQPRFRVLMLGIVVCFTILFVRLIQLQIIEGTTLRSFSEKNLLKEIKIEAPRGRIYDRDGIILTDNSPGFAVTITPQYAKDLPLLAEELEKIINIPKHEIIDKVKKSKIQNGVFRPAIIKDNIDRDQVFRIELLKFSHSGIDINEHFIRNYSVDHAASHLLGYISEISKDQLDKLAQKYEKKYTPGDFVGQKGVEKSYENILSGTNGITFVKVDAKGRQALVQENLEFLGELVDDVAAEQGNSIYLTIDKDLQEKAYNLFLEQNLSGTLVAMNTTGEILAMTSVPGFSPNEFSVEISADTWKKLNADPLKPLRNKAIQDHHSPGSTFKPIVALTGLQEKKISKNQIVLAGDTFRMGNRVWHDHTRTGQGYINIVQAIEASSNVFFYKLGAELGVDNIHRYASAMGLGKKTGIDLQGEIPALIPSSSWKLSKIGEPWQPGESVTVAIGQSYVLVTPLQLAVAYNTIATQGKVVRPQLLKRVISPSGKIVNELTSNVIADLSLESSDVFISQDNFKIVKEGLYKVTHGERGTAKSVRVNNFPIVGKTGTAQVRSFAASEIYSNCFERPLSQRHNGWFAGFAPYENPEVIVVVLAEHACKSSATLPIAKGFFQAYMEKYHPKLSEAPEKSTKNKGS